MPAVAFVVNGTLARAGGRFRALCRAAAWQAGWEPEFLVTGKSEAGTEAARDAVGSGADLVIATGGDGTVRCCAEGLAGTDVPMGIVPLGTANLLARTLGIPRHPRAALRVALTRPSALGSADALGSVAALGAADSARGAGRGGAGFFHGASAQAASAHGTSTGVADRRIDLATADGTPFCAMAGMGLDAAVVAATHLKHQLGWLAYAVSGAAHLALPPTTFTIRLDGGEPFSRIARSVVAGNSGLLPGGFSLLPAARLDDGLLDVGILAPAGPLGWARVATRVLTRSRRQDRQLERFRARRVEITAATGLPREIDGEVVTSGATLTIQIRPKALLVRAPVVRTPA